MNTLFVLCDTRLEIHPLCAGVHAVCAVWDTSWDTHFTCWVHTVCAVWHTSWDAHFTAWVHTLLCDTRLEIHFIYWATQLNKLGTLYRVDVKGGQNSAFDHYYAVQKNKKLKVITLSLIKKFACVKTYLNTYNSRQRLPRVGSTFYSQTKCRFCLVDCDWLKMNVPVLIPPHVKKFSNISFLGK